MTKITRAEWLREIDMLLTGTEHDKFARSHTMNKTATAFILGVPIDQVPKIMRKAGYQGAKIGNSRYYDKGNIFEAAKLVGLFG